MSAAGLLKTIAPRSPRRVLEELVARGDRAAAGGKDRPMVMLELASGRQLQGRCVAVADDGGLPIALLHTGGSERAPQVMHVRTDHVVAVTYDAAKEPPPDHSAPGRLELVRLCAAAGEEVLGSVGAYQLESIGVQLFDKIDGDYFSILGLPLLPLLDALRREGAIDG